MMRSSALSLAMGYVALGLAALVLFAAPLWYANATHFRAELDHWRRRSSPPPRLVVLDALGMYDVDFTGTRALAEALDALARDGVDFAVARAGDHLKDNLARSGLLQRIGAERFYASVNEAVTGASVASSPRRA